ncbi:hypothetical protein EJC49_16575 [Aquibium carbonis]|uniref:DUF5615 domain-containing protein n=1 Tax=Aquibium carbonis TaxID=2495581 RepID=A0A3R9YDP5_9HYPH|nr:hypothetical protein [Aquibium carbonis]RST85248.1 hypothetical protein EJC49_16575 [Aquibium carbonis]
MRTIVDEGVPRRIVFPLREIGCSVDSFPNAWKGYKNGKLLKIVVEGGYGCMLTCDKNLAHQQNLKAAGLALVVLPTHDLAELIGMVDRIAQAISRASVGLALIVPPSSK